MADMRDLAQQMATGEVQLLLICGSNPVFTAPADLNFSQALEEVPLRVHLGIYQDETAVQCHWHIPQTHFLEAWSDARAFDGTASVVQPLIAPLYHGHSAHELISALMDAAPRPGYEIVRVYWRDNMPGARDETAFEAAWENALREGIIANTAFEPRVTLRCVEIGRPSRQRALHGIPIKRVHWKSCFDPTLQFTTADSQITAGCKNCPNPSRS